ncbi:MAG: carboxypeptidase regulatory-like domain-containing protein [Firmicutes bacterium]|nr:carboxypeptidase regulatory-like domain-containing protein [Bacillota bacterium]
MKNTVKLIALLLVVFLAAGFTAGCGNSSDDGGGDNSTGSVEGYVMDENNEPIAGAECTITTTDSRGTYATITDTNGYYSILNVPVGTWPMSVVCSGYSPLNLNVQINQGQTTQNPTSTMPPAGAGSVSGTVYSELIGGTVISGATITAGSVIVTSAANGTYTANGVAAGSQTITATATGYTQYSSTVTVAASSTVTKDIAMTPSSTSSPTPSPGYGNATGKVIDANGSPLADVTVSLQKGDRSTTNSSGVYIFENLTPGVRTLAFAKTGYDDRTQDVTVAADTTVTAPTVTLTETPVTGVTLWVSKRINLPEVGDSGEADVSYDGTKVVFTSVGNVIADWGGGVPDNASRDAGNTQIYVWNRATGTITRVSNNNLVPGATGGCNGDSRYPAISGDGNFVVFRSLAKNILANGLSTTNNRDIFMVRLSDNKTIRISNDGANANAGGNAASDMPDINGDGTKVVFSSLATNIGNINHTATWSHIYYVTVSNMVPGIRRMIDCSMASAEGADQVVDDPESANPSISYDGRYTAYQTKATNLTDGEQPGSNRSRNGVPVKIFRNDINTSPIVGWNLLISKHNGTEANANCQRPSINGDGSRIAFESTSTNLGYSSATTSNIYLWSINSIALKFLTMPLEGAVGENTYAQLDKSGRYVAFRSTAIGLVSDVTNATARIYVKDADSGKNEYTLMRGASGQVPTNDCDEPAMSGDGNYVAFHTASKNLTNDKFTAGIVDTFIRKWK